MRLKSIQHILKQINFGEGELKVQSVNAKDSTFLNIDNFKLLVAQLEVLEIFSVLLSLLLVVPVLVVLGLLRSVKPPVPRLLIFSVYLFLSFAMMIMLYAINVSKFSMHFKIRKYIF